MSNNDIKTIDLNLLKVFVLLMQERSVTAVAERLSLGQPAVSHALARLRHLVGDPLFLRAGRQMEPTPRAEILFTAVEPAITALEGAVRANQPFEPRVTERVFRIAMSDDVQLAFLSQITQALAAQMPKARLVVGQTDYRQAASTLDRKAASLVVGYLDKLPAAAKVRKITRVGYKVLMAKEAVRSDTVDLDDYCARTHALVTFAGDLVGYVDETLADLKRARNIQVSVPTFAVLPYVMEATSHLATVPEYVAAVLSHRHPLTACPLPFKSPEFDLSIAWHAAVDKDPGEILLRKIIIETVRKAIAERPS